MSTPVRLGALLSNYNDAPLLPRAIDALLGQSRAPDEIIVVDDGSTDDSLKTLESYAAAHPNLRVLRNPANRGVVFSTARAQEAATADYLYFASANDYVLPGFFEQAMALAAIHAEAGLIIGQVSFRGSDNTAPPVIQGVGAWNEPGYYPPERFLNDFLEREPVWISLSPSTIYRKAALDEMGGFRPELGPWCDTFVTRSIGLRHGVCFLPAPAVAFFQNPASFSGKVARNPRRSLDIAARGAWLMRSPKFRPIFPPDHVRRWERAQREMIINHYLSQFRLHMFEARQSVAEASAPGKPSFRLLGELFRVSAVLTDRIGAFLAARRLRRYAGDISCYAPPSDKPPIPP